MHALGLVFAPSWVYVNVRVVNFISMPTIGQHYSRLASNQKYSLRYGVRTFVPLMQRHVCLLPILQRRRPSTITTITAKHHVVHSNRQITTITAKHHVVHSDRQIASLYSGTCFHACPCLPMYRVDQHPCRFLHCTTTWLQCTPTIT